MKPPFTGTGKKSGAQRKADRRARINLAKRDAKMERLAKTVHKRFPTYGAFLDEVQRLERAEWLVLVAALKKLRDR